MLYHPTQLKTRAPVGYRTVFQNEVNNVSERLRFIKKLAPNVTSLPLSPKKASLIKFHTPSTLF